MEPSTPPTGQQDAPAMTAIPHASSSVALPDHREPASEPETGAPPIFGARNSVFIAPAGQGHTVPTDIVPEDARLAPLIAMFPNVDVSVIESVLDTVNGDHDRAVDVLLGMTDPSYVSEMPRPAPGQGETDEEMARRLAAEEEFHAAWHPEDAQPQAAARTRGRGGAGNVSRPPPVPRSPPDGNDTFAQVQDQVFKIAESGKKTFMSLMSKAKQKLAELESTSRPRDWHDPTYPNEEAVPETHPRMYEHNVHVPYVAPSGQHYSSTQQQELRGFDVGDSGHTEQLKPTDPISIPAKAPAAASTSGGTSSSPAPASYDASRLGLLPKKPISLIDNTTAARTQKATVDDDDELEYVENPFEEKHGNN